MKKLIGRIAVILSLALTVAGFAAIATACGDDDDKATGYTVKIVDASGAAIDGATGTAGVNGDSIMVQFCVVDAQNTELLCLPDLYKVGADGSTGECKIPALEAGQRYHIKVNGLPGKDNGYDGGYIDKPGTITVTVED